MRIVQRFTKPTHSIGVTIAVPHASFTPTPNMTELEVAHGKGWDAKRRGRKADENPYEEGTTLSDHWLKGHGS